MKEKFISYKYSGKDDSILYEYLISPLCDFLTEYLVPPSIAPNAITLIGFVCNIVATVMIVTNRMAGNAPQDFHFVIFGVLTIVYSVCDNTDGKQARKTKTSSSLGMLLDHGCDSLTCCLLTIGMGTLIGLDDIMLVLLLCNNSFLYFMAYLEQ